jgi:hypothetical protein
MDSRIPTQVPPKGPFSSEALQWTWSFGKVPMQVAHIQLDKVNDFLDEEGRMTREFETSFYIRRKKSNPGPKLLGTRSSPTGATMDLRISMHEYQLHHPEKAPSEPKVKIVGHKEGRWTPIAPKTRMQMHLYFYNLQRSSQRYSHFLHRKVQHFYPFVTLIMYFLQPYFSFLLSIIIYVLD